MSNVNGDNGEGKSLFQNESFSSILKLTYF